MQMIALESPTWYSFQLCDIDYDYAVEIAMQNARISPLTCWHPRRDGQVR